MRFGLNLLLWTDTLSDDFLPILEELKEIGYDGVELPVFGPDEAACAKWCKHMDHLGLARTGTVVRGPDDNPISSDAKIRRAGIDANRQALDQCAALGCEVMAGPTHSALGCFSGKGPTADEWRWGVEGMREVAEHAASVNVTLALEYLNRFECYFLNTAVDGARFVHDVDHPRCRMMYDTFHSHIEEKDVAEAIRSLKDCLAHVHISENDRSTPGTGNVRWAENFDTLREIGYDGFMVVEAFGLALPNLAAATKIWRRMFKSESQLAADALAFMKAEVAKRN